MATTFTVFSATLRTDGTYVSPTAAWDGAQDTGVFYTPICTQAHWAAFVGGTPNPGTMHVMIEQSLDGEVTWEEATSCTWQGNTWGRQGSPNLPSASFQAKFDSRGPRRIRATIVLAGTGAGLVVGLSATINTSL